MRIAMKHFTAGIDRISKSVNSRSLSSLGQAALHKFQNWVQKCREFPLDVKDRADGVLSDTEFLKNFADCNFHLIKLCIKSMTLLCIIIVLNQVGNDSLFLQVCLFLTFFHSISMGHDITNSPKNLISKEYILLDILNVSSFAAALSFAFYFRMTAVPNDAAPFIDIYLIMILLDIILSKLETYNIYNRIQQFFDYCHVSYILLRHMFRVSKSSIKRSFDRYTDYTAQIIKSEQSYDSNSSEPASSSSVSESEEQQATCAVKEVPRTRLVDKDVEVDAKHLYKMLALIYDSTVEAKKKNKSNNENLAELIKGKEELEEINMNLKRDLSILKNKDDMQETLISELRMKNIVLEEEIKNNTMNKKYLGDIISKLSNEIIGDKNATSAISKKIDGLISKLNQKNNPSVNIKDTINLIREDNKKQNLQLNDFQTRVVSDLSKLFEMLKIFQKEKADHRVSKNINSYILPNKILEEVKGYFVNVENQIRNLHEYIRNIMEKVGDQSSENYPQLKGSMKGDRNFGNHINSNNSIGPKNRKHHNNHFDRTSGESNDSNTDLCLFSCSSKGNVCGCSNILKQQQKGIDDSQSMSCDNMKFEELLGIVNNGYSFTDYIHQNIWNDKV